MRRVLPFVILLLIPVAVAAQPVPRHHFDASAFIVADRTTHGNVVLAPSGGESRAVIRHYEGNGVSFDDGESIVSGRMENGVAFTTISVRMHNLNIRDQIHADEVVMRINERQRHTDPEAEITFTGSRFVNLTISGQPVELDIDDAVFARFPTHRSFARAAALGEPFFSQKMDDVFDSPGQPMTTSLVRSIRSSAGSPDAAVPYAVHVDGLGTVYLGEVLVMPGRRHLTMIRVQPDSVSVAEGTGRQQYHPPPSDPISSGGGEGNGTPILP